MLLVVAHTISSSPTPVPVFTSTYLKMAPLRLLLLWFLLAVELQVDTDTVQAQQISTTKATTDPTEARALNTMFARWGISATDQWNISGELCSGVAIGSTPIENINPGIKCNCTFNNSTTCRITALKVFALDIVSPIPDELWTLTMLDDLNLAYNYLTGPLSPSIGNLTRMQYLRIGINALSGAVPRELGMLTDLMSLRFGTNNFSGPLPPELGNLSRLTILFCDSTGVSGPIPQTFASLRSLESFWASNIALTGPIPDFIGNWSSLSLLRFQGNSFQGPIPQSFSNLISLRDLVISDVSNGSSTLDFLRNMNLSSLILRNNDISGPIPPFLGAFQTMTLLDLSFNNLTGTIPASLFVLSSLTNLFLGNNRLTGSLPAVKNPQLQNIDLSYNELSGSFPYWVNEQNLQLNLVANNFTLYNSNRSLLPNGLECLQRNFPCSRGSPMYSSFAVNCGGPQIRTSDRVLYDNDDQTFGPATYYMRENGRWAVSNMGLQYQTDRKNQTYRASTLSQFSNTLDSELFQTARISAGSLRYYGLAMENGNYTVRLQFAESVIVGTKTWRSHGWRVFDIYVQGNLVEKDFDITREASGNQLTAVVRQFTVEVLENHIEINLFWAGKGTCCIPAHGTYGPLISAISATPNFDPTVSNTNPTGLIVRIVVGVAAGTLLFLFAIYFVLWRRKKQKNVTDKELLDLGIDTQPYMFSYAELKAATGDFDHSNKLGEGGFGSVYKGTLGDGRAVAVKLLSVASHQGNNQFVAEIATISAVQHRNLVQLYGCCIEGDKRLLVYEYLENKSLDKLLFGTSKPLSLDWAIRYDICLGVARGLAYLHEESRLRIVHRDVKASNILLDSNFTPKISDFGLAKLYDDRKTHISTRVAGTIGYLAPEYAMLGHLTEKADIFSFGVVALEILSGRSNSNTSLQDDMIYLLEWAWKLHENNREIELVDPDLQEYNLDEVKRIIGVSLLCTQASPALRPAMSRVVGMLSGDIEVTFATTRPGYLIDWRFSDATTFMTAEADILTSDLDTNHTNTRTEPVSPVDPTKPMLL